MRAFAWMTWMCVVMVVAGCHPISTVVRDEVEGPGTGGSGNFNTIRAKILAALAAKDYEHARHLVQLAADLEEHERARFEQMISAAERKLVPFLEGALKHIFRAAPGHFAAETAEARELIQTTVIEEYFVGISADGNRVYARLLETGAQIWAFVRNGTIRDGGCNDAPWPVQELLR